MMVNVICLKDSSSAVDTAPLLLLFVGCFWWYSIIHLNDDNLFNELNDNHSVKVHGANHVRHTHEYSVHTVGKYVNVRVYLIM